MPRPMWKGQISFGMVSIPVALYPADRTDEISFELLDDRDLSPIGYRKVNKNSGREVPSEHIVRGFRLDDGQVVTVTDEDLKKASPERTQTINLHGFVDRDQIKPAHFVRPFYLEPVGQGAKGYALLRDALAASGKVGIGSVVLRTREHLAAVMVDGPWLVLNTLRYPSELRDPQGLQVPSTDPKKLGVGEKELKMAERLVGEMVEPWQPERFHDTYRDELKAAIQRKAESGEARPVTEPESEPGPRKAPVSDLMSLLKESVARAERGKPRRSKTG